jgi:alanine--tRNA ligase
MSACIVDKTTCLPCIERREKKAMKSNEIRRTFLDYFIKRGHTCVPTSSLVPVNDPTLLFINAGMVPFKNTFLGLEERSYGRACSVQKCLRVSGKHNDLENVGSSPRHHTFFEMLGNFSFGDYSKREAIHYAWDLLTRVWQLPVERLWVTVYVEDDEAALIWDEVGVAHERILRFGDKDNFWSMGSTGPCGPSSEIHYYQGEDITVQKAAGVNSVDDDYMEIWNLVFIQYNRDEQGHLTPLDRLAVDTGMGFERIVSVLQGVTNNYETDLFQPILQRIQDLLNVDPEHYSVNKVAYHTIADHSRAIAFLIADGVLPDNTGRNYVLRRIIRRAAYLGRTLGFEQPFLADVAEVTVQLLGEVYPELQTHCNDIREVTITEEKRFLRTLKAGMKHLDVVTAQLRQQGWNRLPGTEAFKLSDTYGFPLDLTQKILADRGLVVDVEEYEAERLEQQQRSRNASLFKVR